MSKLRSNLKIRLFVWVLVISIITGGISAQLTLFLSRGVDVAENQAILFGAGIGLVLSILGSLLIQLILRQPIKAIEKATQTAREVASGNFDVDFEEAKRGDEVDQLMHELEVMVVHIRKQATQMGSSSDKLTASAQEIAAAVQEGNASGESIRTAMAELSTKMNENVDQAYLSMDALGAVKRTMDEVAKEMNEALKSATVMQTEAENGKTLATDSVEAMHMISNKMEQSATLNGRLTDMTGEISRITDVISDISAQTNLLSLNASIEAARAGEAGRGFAVVADEVRNLAHRTQDSAQQVQKMIEELQVGARQAVSIMTESQRESENSVGIANQAGERLGSVTQRIGEIDGMNQSVATATEEQTAVVESINVDINEINTLNQEGVENLQATLRACSDLEQQAARLKHLVGSFRI